MDVHSAKTQSWLCAQWAAKDPSFLQVDSEDWADAQADLSSLGTHAILCVLSGGDPILSGEQK